MKRLDPRDFLIPRLLGRLVAAGLFPLQRAAFLQHRLKSFGDSSGVQFLSPLTILQKNNKRRCVKYVSSVSRPGLVRTKPWTRWRFSAESEGLWEQPRGYAGTSDLSGFVNCLLLLAALGGLNDIRTSAHRCQIFPR